MKHLMVDLETLGTTADAVICSIGAVKFDLETMTVASDGFYASIDVSSNLELGRRINEDTLLWWFKQPANAQAVMFEDKISLVPALEEFSDWIGDDGMYVWAKGSSFDVAMLEHAYKQAKIEVPWKFWNTRCVRTYEDLPGAKMHRAQQTGVKHNALADAVTQAETIVNIHRALFAPAAKMATKAVAKARATK